MSVVIDASALLAILGDERGGDTAAAGARGALLGSVNYSEILAKMSDRGIAPARLHRLIERLQIAVDPFTGRQAEIAASLRSVTRYQNVSLADRACLAVAIDKGLPLLTADSDWAKLDFGRPVEIVLIR